ncbi:hypothetical protein BCU70_01315 [Vibrio sp. 10N.286.49.C2]|uniref:DUF1868 domain-containing protein n=1 Tax=unclassified Vibrio TaxID=2614977 RepID=UPI000C82B4B4|nr:MULTISPECIES: DUF1868 domain-containing protein [unclassified Vibrio]PMH42828.1 hypothetical protein BCU70_01315 [Vibrio sp. 10N.286.49.C2]PMH53833.1 hypothetical protein BCU66_13520 [Vibrio sp. 10N.286.49.B1]PMH80286.1 hypothetical protein BCU58_23955 [Vibrio sp. 10N.286.48.B7]
MKYAPSVGVKFHEDGSVRTFPGNTFICHLDPSIALIDELRWAQDELKAMQCGHKFAFLPISSMHMTVFEGVCDQIRDANKWTSKLDLNAKLSEVTDLFATEVDQLGALGGFEMMFDYVYNCTVGGSALRVKPANDASLTALKQCRALLKTATGISMPDFDDYHFHITLSYRVIELDEQDKIELLETTQRIEQRISQSFGTLTHGPVEFCTFQDMFEFKAVATLI